jgi:predicted HicB family RNase H-like nuclease
VVSETLLARAQGFFMRGVKIELDLSMEMTRIKRPPFPSRAARPGAVTIPVTDAIHKTLQSAARSRGISLTHWARAVLLRAAAEARQDSQSFSL